MAARYFQWRVAKTPLAVTSFLFFSVFFLKKKLKDTSEKTPLPLKGANAPLPVAHCHSYPQNFIFITFIIKIKII
jgi:hypothetical protein